MKRFSKREKCSLITGLVGLVLAVFALVMALYGFPKIIETELKKNIVLEEGNDAWDRFVELPFPLLFKVYLFEIENEIEYLRGDEKPKLKQIGPFVFNQYRKKENINIDGDFVTFYQKQHYEFNRDLTPPELSNEMEIRTINLLELGMFQVLEKSTVPPPFQIEGVLSEVFVDSNFIQNFRVQDILFNGVDFCLPERTKFSGKFACLLIMLLNIKMIQYNEDRSMTYSIFGFKQDKHDGLYKVNRGTSDLKSVGNIVEWENLTYTNFWNKKNGDECDKVGGLDSTVYPPYIEENDSFLIYATDICRSAKLRYAGHSSYRDTDTCLFRMDERTFFPEEGQRPEESCYCIKQTKNTEGLESCFLDGVMDVQSCLGIPAVMSLPHFLHADKKYLEMIDGLKPDPKIHESEMGIQPYTGFPTNGFKKAQINLIMRPADIKGQHVTVIENIKTSVMPIIWIEEGLEMNDEYYGILSTALSLIIGVNIGQWVFVGVTVLLFIIPTGFFLVFKMKS